MHFVHNNFFSRLFLTGQLSSLYLKGYLKKCEPIWSSRSGGEREHHSTLRQDKYILICTSLTIESFFTFCNCIETIKPVKWLYPCIVWWAYPASLPTIVSMYSMMSLPCFFTYYYSSAPPSVTMCSPLQILICLCFQFSRWVIQSRVTYTL